MATPEIPDIGHETDEETLLREGSARWDAHVAEVGPAGIVAEVEEIVARAEENWAGMLPEGAITNFPWSTEPPAK
jgi:hypothetical protein